MIDDSYITVSQCMPATFVSYFERNYAKFECLDFGSGVYDVLVESVIQRCEDDAVKLAYMLECDLETGNVILNYCRTAMNSRAYIY